MPADIGPAFASRYRAPLISYFLRRLSNKAEAEDLAHDVILRVMEKVDVNTLTNPEGFLFRTAANLLQDHARRAKTRHDRRPELEQLQDQLEVLSPERVLLGRQSLDRALASLMKLPKKTRDMFIKHRIEGLKYGEIAAHYGVTVSSVEKHLIKALAHIARNIER